MQLLLVGEENVGKTSLANFLLHDTLANASHPNVATNGVSISDWTTPELQRSARSFCSACFEYYTTELVLPDVSGRSTRPKTIFGSRSSSPLQEHNRKVSCPKCSSGTIVPDALSLSVWDFGGQSVFYPTHSLFLVPPLPI